MSNHEPSGRRDDPLYVTPTGRPRRPGDPSAGAVFALVAYVAAVALAFGLGAPVFGVILLVLGVAGLVFALMAKQGQKLLDENPDADPRR